MSSLSWAERLSPCESSTVTGDSVLSVVEYQVSWSLEVASLPQHLGFLPSRDLGKFRLWSK